MPFFTFKGYLTFSGLLLVALGLILGGVLILETNVRPNRQYNHRFSPTQCLVLHHVIQLCKPGNRSTDTYEGLADISYPLPTFNLTTGQQIHEEGLLKVYTCGYSFQGVFDLLHLNYPINQTFDCFFERDNHRHVITKWKSLKWAEASSPLIGGGTIMFVMVFVIVGIWQYIQFRPGV